MTDTPTFSSQDEALSFFDGLPAVTPAEMTGLWKGAGLKSGHPLDGVLENLGWYGKRFHPDRRADALLFSTGSRRLVPLDPAALPLRLLMPMARLAKTRAARNLFRNGMRRLWARGTIASLRMERFRGLQSVAMAYDRQPIIDHFRRMDEIRVMGAMEIAGSDRIYTFQLEKIEEVATACRDSERAALD